MGRFSTILATVLCAVLGACEPAANPNKPQGQSSASPSAIETEFFNVKGPVGPWEWADVKWDIEGDEAGRLIATLNIHEMNVNRVKEMESLPLVEADLENLRRLGRSPGAETVTWAKGSLVIAGGGEWSGNDVAVYAGMVRKAGDSPSWPSSVDKVEVANGLLVYGHVVYTAPSDAESARWRVLAWSAALNAAFSLREAAAKSAGEDDEAEAWLRRSAELLTVQRHLLSSK